MSHEDGTEPDPAPLVDQRSDGAFRATGLWAAGAMNSPSTASQIALVNQRIFGHLVSTLAVAKGVDA
jgi:hypothetical protein